MLSFPPSLRLRTRGDYDAVQKGGRKVSARYATVIVRPNDLGRDRLGVIASRRVGGAVVRNRAKRRIREVFRQQRPPARPAGARTFDVVVIARTALADAPFAAVEADLSSVLRKLRS